MTLSIILVTRSLRATRNIHTIIRAHRRLRTRRVIPPPLVTRSPAANRHRLARALLVLAFLFVVCWIPYSAALVTWTVQSTQVTLTLVQISLVLAHAHAALSPVIYWLMTRSFSECLRSITASSSSPTGLFGCCSNVCACLTQPRSSQWVHNSSTNEDNLGPFHPKYLNPRMLKPQVSRCTSHYFH